MNPELGGEEFQTQALIIDYLAKLVLMKSVKVPTVWLALFMEVVKAFVGLMGDIDALLIDN